MRLARANALYLVAAVLFVASLAMAAATSRGEESALDRSGSVTDQGPGGAAVLRRWLDGLGVTTRAISGDRFEPAARADQAVLVLGATEPLTPADVTALRRTAAAGGTVIVATEAGLMETLLLDALGVRLASFAPVGEYEALGAYPASAGARRVSIDRGRELEPGARGLPLVRAERGPLAASVREGSGTIHVVGSLAPFLSGQIADADNGRFVLALLAPALRGGTVAFDEYHHGSHPAPDVMAVLERTWPGRALLAGGAILLAFVLLTGRRLGPPLPLEHRPARSSLDHVRAFAGLVRRSGHSEIARERLRHDLRAGVARAVGMDPRAPFERLVGALAHVDPLRAAEARELDALLARRLREGDLLRSVRRIDALIRPERGNA